MARRSLAPRDVVFVMARSASGRPTLMHQLRPGSSADTLCGRDMREWSRTFLSPREARPIVELLYCKRCGKVANA